MASLTTDEPSPFPDCSGIWAGTYGKRTFHQQGERETTNMHRKPVDRTSDWDKSF